MVPIYRIDNLEFTLASVRTAEIQTRIERGSEVLAAIAVLSELAPEALTEDFQSDLPPESWWDADTYGARFKGQVLPEDACVPVPDLLQPVGGRHFGIAVGSDAVGGTGSSREKELHTNFGTLLYSYFEDYREGRASHLDWDAAGLAVLSDSADIQRSTKASVYLFTGKDRIAADREGFEKLCALTEPGVLDGMDHQVATDPMWEPLD